MKNLLLIFTVIFLISCQEKNNGTIPITEKASALHPENKRIQIVSLENMSLLDSLRSIYLIPVGQKFLDKAENIDESGSLGLFSSERYSYGGYNNFVLYFEKEKRTLSLFKDRFLIRLLEFRKVDDEITLIFSALNKDSNKSGSYDSEDIKSLFVYSLKNEKIVEIFEPYKHYLDYQIVPRSNDIIVHYGLDRDSSGTFERSDEPMTYIQFNLETNERFNVVNDSLMDNIQGVLDGKK